MNPTPILLIGGGMIAHDQILPALYQMQRESRIGDITVCAQHGRTVQALAEAPALKTAFPDRTFHPLPDYRQGDATGRQPELYKQALAQLPPRSIAVVATPDQTHYGIVMDALRADQHVCCVKPLVLDVQQSIEIEQEAERRGLLVAIEYHKRFDPRSQLARSRYRQGLFGDLKLGAAALMEKWYYRHSNFQNWFTCEETDSFVYIGCHYVDLVHFITGLRPVAVSVYGIRDRFPNGNEGFLWADARVLWENGACLNIQTSLSFPDAAPGPNTQGLTLYFSGKGNAAWLQHSDQYRGLKYAFTEKSESPGGTQYAEPSPDYFMYQDLGGPGLVPWGYGVRSVDYIVSAAIEIESQTAGLEEEAAVAERRKRIAAIEQAGIIATPGNSRYNELVCQAARLSILNDGHEVEIHYDPPGVAFR
ncbi:MAG: Gfo/Idh/MocA family oxidoreductase [Bryobacterales bacterium]